jgi:benzoate membrane transport protein
VASPAVITRAGIPRLRWAFTDLNSANLTAGLTVALIYLCGPVAFYLAAVEGAGIASNTALSGFVVVFLSAGVGTIALSLAFRQPLAVGWSVPGLIYLAAVAPSYSDAELVGACLVAGVITMGLALTGLTERLSSLLPFPVVMAVLAGSSLAYCSQTFTALGKEPLIVGPAVVGFFLVRALGKPWLPPLGGAILFGVPALLIAGEVQQMEIPLALPGIHPVFPAFAPQSFLVLSLPLVLLAAGVGTAEGFGFLRGLGFSPPTRATNVTLALMSILHAFFAAPPATLQRTSVVFLAGEGAGPKSQRYMAGIIASIGAIAIGILAIPAASFVLSMPPTFLAALVGLVLLAVMMDALHRAVTSDVPFGAFIAFVVATSALSVGGLGATFWALVAGVIAVNFFDRRAPRRA